MSKESIYTMKAFDDCLFSGLDCGEVDCLYNLAGKCSKEMHNIAPIPFSFQGIFRAQGTKCPSAEYINI